MHLHVLQHVSFEGPGHIATWADKNGHHLTTTHVYRGEALPDHAQYDRLVIMGGPMNIYEHKHYPWLKAEKQFIRAAIAEGKTIIGICLGAQLLADALGARVATGPQKEIGLFPVSLNEQAASLPLFAGVPERFTALHWHGDTFELPKNAMWLASSAACAHQAFLAKDRILGLQFHLEATASSLASLFDHCADEVVASGPFVHSRQEMEKGMTVHASFLHSLLETILDRLP